MPAGVKIQHKRKASAFVGGELAAGEMGLDTTNAVWYFSTDGTTVQAISVGGGGETKGITTVNFGAFPGTSDTVTTITGQAGITSGSIVRVSKRLVATAEHSADEHWVEEWDVDAGNIVVGTGFTIFAKALNRRLYGTWTVAWGWI